MKTKNKFKKSNAFVGSSANIFPMDNIERWQCVTKNKNTLSVFYNRDTNLVVIDVIASNDKGGNEVFRQTIDEDLLLAHTK